MAVELSPGVRLRSAVCSTEVIVVRAPGGAVDLCCGGYPMVAPTEGPPVVDAVAPSDLRGTQLGKRYVDEVAGLEVLCTKSGDGGLALGGSQLELKDAKALPSSD
jgi:hypothetical protein